MSNLHSLFYVAVKPTKTKSFDNFTFKSAATGE